MFYWKISIALNDSYNVDMYYIEWFELRWMISTLLKDF